MTYDFSMAFTVVNPDGSITQVPGGCWEDLPYHYSRSGDSLIVRTDIAGSFPTFPQTLTVTSSTLMGVGTDLQDEPLRLRYERASAGKPFCPAPDQGITAPY
ncbi:MAG TPA: hypothetical protein VG692_13060 [Gemmatimonadales bacterium]|nr:hypothetical protein [Gemmatimonadales bacterium]